MGALKYSKVIALFKNKAGADFINVFSHAKNYVTAELFSKGLAFLSLPILTRLMTPDEYGVMAVFVSFCTVASIIFGFGFRGAVSRYYYEQTKDFYSFFSSSFWFIALLGIPLLILAYFYSDFLKDFLNIPLGMIYFSLAIVIPQALFELYQGYLQSASNSKKVAFLNIVNATIITVLTIGIMFFMREEKYYGKAIAQLVAIFVMLGVMLYGIKGYLTFSIEKTHIQYGLIFGLPVVLHLLSNYILTAFDQIIINDLVGKKETGFYSIAYRIGMMQNIIAAGILKAWTPIFFEKMNRKDYVSINSLIKKYSFFILLIALVLIFFSEEIVDVLVDNSYKEALSIIPIIIAAYYFSFVYTIYVNYSFYKKKTKNIAFFTILAGIVNISLNYMLIPKLGYKVAAWTTLISFIVLFLLHYFNVKYIIKISNLVSIKTFIIPVILLAIIVGSYFIILTLEVDYWIILALRLMVVVLFGTICLKYIKRVDVSK